uniref:Uncharacterized protein n=1 Tax=viral metagenome TaxID=1070528 RepID=A0A6C0J225_9ZZZZ
MSKTHFVTRSRFVRHIDSKFEIFFDENLKQTFSDYFNQNPDEMKPENIKKLKKSLSEIMFENVEIVISTMDNKVPVVPERRRRKKKEKEQQEEEPIENEMVEEKPKRRSRKSNKEE